MTISTPLRWLVAILLSIGVCLAAGTRGQVTFGGLPVPGATITAKQGDKTFTTVVDPQGNYAFPDLPDGTWTVRVEMLGFAPLERQIVVGPDTPASAWDLKMLSLPEIKAAKVPATPPAAIISAAPSGKGSKKKNSRKDATSPTNTQTAFQKADVNAANASAPPAAAANQGEPPAAPESEAAPPPNPDFGNASASELNERAAGGFLINGTSNNGASSPFALNQAFGNNRRGLRSLYNGNLGLTFDNSSLDARNFSLTGQDTLKPSYNLLTGLFSFGGPIRIPRVLPNGPNFIVNYQWTRNRTATTPSGLMPDAAERGGAFSTPIFDPTTGTEFPNNTIPASRISPQAQALLNYYPLPNFGGSDRYNYQIPLLGITHQDALQTRLNKGFRRDQFFGTFALQDIRSDTPSLFGFLDTADTLGINSIVNWRHQFTPRFFTTFGYQYSRQSVRVIPFFDNRENVSGEAGIEGNNQDPVNWGPPALTFASGISGLTDMQSSNNRNQTGALSFDGLWTHGRHEVSFGADYKRQQFNYFSQQNPRGSFMFTGAATQEVANGLPVAGTGSDFADFLLGIPDTSSIAFGNPDKYFRDSLYDAYALDNWRMSPGVTVNAGGRWEYGSPISELYGRLVNLDIAPGFTAVAPVVGTNPVGPLTGISYPSSLIQPDKTAFQPRIGLAWRPLPASSLLVRAGYGVYYNTSVYQTIATQMAQQAPLSTSLSVQNSPADRLSLANGFIASPGITPTTFAIDPDFRVGYSQNWQVSVQKDLPASLQMLATYAGIKGTREVQEFLPNTYPFGAVSPCSSCPTGFAYMASNGNSTRESGQIQLRRRLHSGFTATVAYTYSKSIDDAALGGRGQGTAVIAQNWLDLSAERGLSNFDQRHLLSVQAQYTTGMGLAGGSLLNGWRGALLKEWTFLGQLSAGSGLPLTPIYSSLPVPGTGVVGSIRPDYTGASVYNAAPGFFLNSKAYVQPQLGQWGNAGRDSITGPDQFTLNASLQRTFRVSDRLNLNVRVDATNVLNHVTYAAWNTNITNAQFGLATAANAMRSLQTTLRLGF